MAQLLVRNIPDSLVKALEIRAAEHDVSAEDEHRRILAEAMAETEKSANTSNVKSLLDLTIAEEVDDSDDWVFERNDPRNAKSSEELNTDKQTASSNFKDHLSALCELEEDVSFERPRSYSTRPASEL